jgi:hypothetical protein
MIHRTLLTTPYCTDITLDACSLEFYLHTAILRVNEQLSAEAVEILTLENYFIRIIVSSLDLHLEMIPTFKRLLEVLEAN